MKIRPSAPVHNPRTTLLLADDVSKDTLHLFSRFESHGPADGREVTLEDRIPNRTDAVERVLRRARVLAAEHGYPTVCVLCESSGGYERLFLSIARRMGLRTALVSPERVHGLKKVESLDTGKTDRKGARVIHLAATLGKTHRHRALPEPYVLLRHLTAFHDDEVATTSALRTRLIATLRDLFPDYNRPATFIFGKTGRALLAAGLLDPHRLVSLGRARVARMVRSRVKGVKGATLNTLMEAAALSVRSAPAGPVAEALSSGLSALLSEIEHHEGQAKRLKEEIEELGALLKAEGELPAIDEAVDGITLFNLARIVGQTGPLSDFASKRQLLRYAGMNLRERESGTYKGRTRLSKKGRPLLRKVLGQAVFPVLRGDRLLGERYAERRERMPEQKARVAAMRKLLVVIYGVHRSGTPVDPARVHLCQSQYAAAA